jgi:transcriptional regulator, LacI family
MSQAGGRLEGDGLQHFEQPPDRRADSEATRQRVLAAVQELGYYPNAVARALARQRADAIAIVLQFPAIFQAGHASPTS